jgi:hypothetical protein
VLFAKRSDFGLLIEGNLQVGETVEGERWERNKKPGIRNTEARLYFLTNNES